MVVHTSQMGKYHTCRFLLILSISRVSMSTCIGKHPHLHGNRAFSNSKGIVRSNDDRRWCGCKKSSALDGKRFLNALLIHRLVGHPFRQVMRWPWTPCPTAIGTRAKFWFSAPKANLCLCRFETTTGVATSSCQRWRRDMGCFSKRSDRSRLQRTSGSSRRQRQRHVHSIDRLCEYCSTSKDSRERVWKQMH